MIVNANENSVLEFFWRHRAKTALNRIKPADFFTLRTRHVDVQHMRNWLALQPDCASVRSLDDKRIIKRINDGVRSREIAVAEVSPGPRLPHTGVVLSSLYGPVLLLPYRKLARIHDLSFALEWLKTLDGAQIKWLCMALGDADEWRVRDIIESPDPRYEIERRLKSGRLIPVATNYPTFSFDRFKAKPVEAPADLKRFEEPKEIEEPSTFDTNLLVKAQAATLQAAAQAVQAFCEICNELAAQAKKTWVEIVLVDENNNPIAGQAYEIKLPDGSVVSGVTNRAGRARYDGIPTGQCKVRFPEIDGNEWQGAQ
jgi:hypothetical protein